MPVNLKWKIGTKRLLPILALSFLLGLSLDVAVHHDLIFPNGLSGVLNELFLDVFMR